MKFALKNVAEPFICESALPPTETFIQGNRRSVEGTNRKKDKSYKSCSFPAHILYRIRHLYLVLPLAVGKFFNIALQGWRLR
jgi:hypothetical protein